MSDFLTRLAERQLGQIETIEPRIKPLYATTGHASRLPSIFEEIPYAPPRRDEKVGTQESSQLRAPKVGSTRSVDSVHENFRVTPPPRFEAHTESEGRSKHPGAEPVKRDSESIQLGHRDAEDAPSIAAKVSLVQPPADIEPIDAPKPKESDAASGTRPLLVPSAQGEPVAPRPVNSTQDVPVQGEAEPAAPVSLATRKHRVDELPKPPADGPVQVTIGRIEVTVLAQATPSKRAAPARKTSLSLDAYLARRHGRER